MSTPLIPADLRRRVEVWFGEHRIIDHVSDPEYAAKFEAAMRRRFASLRVTNQPAGDER